MAETLLNKYGIKQIGYYVESIEEAAQRFRDLLGAGPFVDLGVSEPASLTYRGASSGMRSRCALGHFGAMQIELIEVLTDEPDVYKNSAISACIICASGPTTSMPWRRSSPRPVSRSPWI